MNSTTALLLTGLLVLGPSARPQDTDSDARGLEQAQARLVEAKGKLRLLLRMSKALPRSPLNAEELVQGRDTRGLALAQELTAWISENIRWLPYAGALRGVGGTLLERRAGTLDTALLLAASLEAKGVSNRLAQARLSPETAARLHGALREKDRAQDEAVEPQSSDEGRDFLAACGVNEADLQAPLAQAMADSQAWLEEVVPASIRQAQDLRALLAKNGVAPKDEDLVSTEIEELRHHTWVQVEVDGEGGAPAWRDLDPLALRGNLDLSVVPDTTFTLAELPKDQEHRLGIRVVAERSAVNGRSTTVALEEEFLARDLTGGYFKLWFRPMTPPDSTDLTELATNPEEQQLAEGLAQTEWLPVLEVVDLRGEATKHHQKSILRTGDLNDDPSLDTRKTKLKGAVTGLSGLGQAATTVNTTLSAVWIEYEFTAPGAAPYRVRRAIFDLVDPVERALGAPFELELPKDQRAERALALGSLVSVRPTNCDLTEEFLVRERLFAMTQNQRLFVQLAQRALEDPTADPMDLVGGLRVPPVELAVLAHSRFRVGRHSARGFLDQLNLTSTHARLFQTDPDGAPKTPALYFGQAVDIVENAVGVRAADEDGAASSFSVRVEQGVLDTVLESTVLSTASLGPAALDDRALVPDNTSRWARSHPVAHWALVPAHDGIEPLSATQARTALHLPSQNHVAVVPPPVDGDLEPATFWSVDRSSGTTLGIGPRGWGQDAPETAITVAEKVTMIGPVRYHSVRMACLFIAATAMIAVGIGEGVTAAGGRPGILMYAHIIMQTLSSTGAANLAARAAFARCLGSIFG